MCDQVERRLECTAESVPKGRRWAAEALRRFGLPEDEGCSEVRDNLLLVVSELLSNAVRASRLQVGFRLEAHRDYLVVAVTDDSPAPARWRDPGPEESHGRGVAIVAAVSDEWGQSGWDGTKTVWSKLRLPSSTQLMVHCGSRLADHRS